LYRGKGCNYCNKTGFYGRSAIHEILVVNEAIRTAILEKPRADYIRRIAIDQGMVTLRTDGWQKVIDGVTTPTEVINVTDKEEAVSTKVQGASAGSSQDMRKADVAQAVMHSYRVISPEVLSTKNEYNSRTYTRIDEKIRIRYKVFHQESMDARGLTVKGDDFEHETETVNVSAGGLLFISHAAVEVGAILEVVVQLPQDNASVRCLAKVSRVEEDDITLMFKVAVYYLDIASADRAKIREFVQDKAAKQEPTT